MGSNAWRCMSQGVESVYDLDYNGVSGQGQVAYGDVFKRAEREFSAYNFEIADTGRLIAHFADAEKRVPRASLIGADWPCRPMTSA